MRRPQSNRFLLAYNIQDYTTLQTNPLRVCSQITTLMATDTQKGRNLNADSIYPTRVLKQDISTSLSHLQETGKQLF